MPTLVTKGHVFDRRPTGVAVKLKSERFALSFFPLSGTLFSRCGCRVDVSNGEHTCAVLAPVRPPKEIYD